jgi:hypothetical protein
MSSDNDAKELKRCFQSTIDSVHETITKSQPLDVSTSVKSIRNSILNNELIDELKIIEIYFPHLNMIFKEF